MVKVDPRLKEKEKIVVEPFKKPKYKMRVISPNINSTDYSVETYEPKALQEEILTNLTNLETYYTSNKEEYFNQLNQNQLIKETDIVGYDVDKFRVEFTLVNLKTCNDSIMSLNDIKKFKDSSVSYVGNDKNTAVIEIQKINEDNIETICSGIDLKFVNTLGVNIT